MKISQTIIDKILKEPKFRRKMAADVNVAESVLRYRAANNTKLDGFEFIEYFKSLGFSEQEIINNTNPK